MLTSCRVYFFTDYIIRKLLSKLALRVNMHTYAAKKLHHSYLYDHIQNVYCNLSYFILFILIEEQNIKIMSTIIYCNSNELILSFLKFHADLCNK